MSDDLFWGTVPFWSSAAEGRLVVPCCRTCGHHFFPPEPRCPTCRAADWSWTDVDGRGLLVTYSVVERGPSEQFPVPYVLAVVELDQGPRMLSNLVGVRPGEIRIGMPLRVDFVPSDGARRLPVFRAAGDGRLSD